MSRHTKPPGTAPNYTNAFIGAFGMLVFCGLCMIWVLYGLLWALATSWGLDRGILWLGGRRRA